MFRFVFECMHEYVDKRDASRVRSRYAMSGPDALDSGLAWASTILGAGLCMPSQRDEVCACVCVLAWLEERARDGDGERAAEEEQSRPGCARSSYVRTDLRRTTKAKRHTLHPAMLHAGGFLVPPPPPPRAVRSSRSRSEMPMERGDGRRRGVGRAGGPQG